MQQQLNFITCLTILVQITDQKATIDGKKFTQKIFLGLLFVGKIWRFYFYNLNYNWSDFLDLRKLQEQVKKTFCYQNLF